MMLNVHTEMPTGIRSKGFDRDTIEAATHIFDLFVADMTPWKNFTADVVMIDEHGKEIRREHIENA